MNDEQIIRALAVHVMGWELGTDFVVNGGRVQMRRREYLRPDHYAVNWNPLTNDADACAVVDKMATDQGYGKPGYSWEGPLFKPENRYLTPAGYPIGTVCWYVIIERDWLLEFVCDPDRRRATCIAALKASGLSVE